MWTLRREVETILFIALATGISLFVLTQIHKRPVHIYSPVLPNFLSVTPTPTPKPFLLIQNSFLDSPDGSETLGVQKTHTREKNTYVFSITNQADHSQKQLFTLATDSTNDTILPLNGWDPNNKYIFIKQSPSTFVVFSSSGAPFANGQQTINITEKFKEKLPDHMLIDVTGWAGPGLIILNTKDSNGNFVSFWFDVISQSFIPLATKFY